MSGISFGGVTGGAATNTSFFGPMPDKFTMLSPGHMSSAGAQIDAVGTPVGTLTPAQMQLISNWTIFNTVYVGGANAATLTLGATTTAPDGTSNAIHLSETTTNSFHAMVTISFNQNPGAKGGATYRFGVFAKQAERTRIALQLGTYNGTGFQGGSTTVFDLANGVVAVAGASSGSASPAWLPVKDTIKAWPNGWYQCEIDVTQGQITNSPSGTHGIVFVDSGSGAGALSNSYTGTAGNGVYVWKGTMLPPAAWGMGLNTIFFDDFTSLSTIDTGNTKAAGFNWYIHNSWNEGSQLGLVDGNLGDSNPAAMSVSNSVLTINPTPGPLDGNYPTNILMSACFLGTPGVYTPNAGNLYNLGFLFRPPALIEFKGTFNMNIALSGPTGDWADWTVAIDSLTLGHQSPAPYGASPYVEIEFTEWIPGGGHTTDVNSNQERENSEQATFGVLGGTPIYYSNLKYGLNSVVFYQGALYQRNGTGSGTINGQVPTNATYWNTFSPAAGAGSINSIDVTQMNLYQTLWVAQTPTDCTHVVIFCNGYYVGEGVHARSGNLLTTWNVADTHQYPIFLQTPSGDVATASWDYVRVSQ